MNATEFPSLDLLDVATPCQVLIEWIEPASGRMIMGDMCVPPTAVPTTKPPTAATTPAVETTSME